MKLIIKYKNIIIKFRTTFLLSTKMLRMHIWLALIASQAAAIVETTRFTRAKGPDGSDGKYISLDSEHSSQWLSPSGQLY